MRCMMIYTLGPFRLNTQDDLLYRGQEPLALGRRATALLRKLLDKPGTVVTKDELIEAAWPNQVVEENNLTVQIAALRRVLGEAAGGKSWIETMPRRGYRFVGPVATAAGSDIAPPPRSSDMKTGGPIQHSSAEHRPITAMSCELIVAAEDVARMSLDDWHQAVDAFHRRVSKIADRYQGFVARHMGNNVLVVFGYPAAHERDAEQAVRAGLAICAATGTLEFSADVPLRCRVGLATGNVIIGGLIHLGDSREYEILGHAPNLAARLQMCTQTDMVAIDAQTWRLVGGLFDCRDLGPIVPAYDDAEPIRRWHVLGERGIESRFKALRGPLFTPLVGRNEEIQLLLRRWGRADKGEGQVVLITGEPGIGKSRITIAFEEQLQNKLHRTLRCFCSPYHQDSALHPFADHLGRAAEFIHGDTPADRLQKLRVLLACSASTEEDVALIADLLQLPSPTSDHAMLSGLSVRRKRQRTLDILIRHFEMSARGQPTVLLFEDVHWMDPTSRELLDLMIPRIHNLPILMLITFRPEFQPNWVDRPQVTTLTLSRLDARDRVTMARHVAGGKALPPKVLEQIGDRTDGVPLFVEELTKSVLESSMVREQKNRYVLDHTQPQLAIPASLHASLMARLDRLEAARHVAQVGAAIGREFPYRLLHAVCPISDDELRAALTRLVASGLLFQRSTPPDAVYTFKHALLQDAAHDSLLRDNRQRLHAAIAQALEIESPELLEGQPELFAQHYAEARLVEQSVHYWGKAGRRSAARSALAEAAGQFQKALDQLQLLPDTAERQRQELEYCIALGAALQTSKGFSMQQTGRAYTRATELWQHLGYPVEYLRAPMGQSGYHTHRGELDLAQRLNAHFVTLTHELDEPIIRCMVHVITGRTSTFQGRFSEARRHLEKAGTLYDQIPHDWQSRQAGLPPRIGLDGYLATVLLCVGYPDTAMAKIRTNIAYAQSIAHTPSMTLAHVFGASMFSLVGDDVGLEGEVQRVNSLAGEHGFALYTAQGTIFRGWLEVRKGHVASGLVVLNEGLDTYRSGGSLIWLPHYLDILASAYEIAGQCEEAMKHVNSALRIIERTGERWFAAELHRHKGQLLARQGNAGAAEDRFYEALTIAQAQGARLWELRAVMSLVRLHRDQGRRAGACQLLGSTYRCFTEGFGTPDLRAAKDFLNELHDQSAVEVRPACIHPAE